jgi:simple sugar transport system permease protein
MTAPLESALGASSVPQSGSPFMALLRGILARPEFGPGILLLVEIITFALLRPEFLSAANISNILAFTPELGMIALGMTLLMTAGEFDLSVGSTFGLTALVMWTLYNEGVTSLEIGFLIAMSVALFIGFINGFFVTRFKISSFLVTLGMQLLLRGIALYISDGLPQSRWQTDSQLVDILVGQFTIGDLRLFTSLLWFTLFAVILAYVLMKSRLGNWIQAAGGNANAALARGVPVRWTKIALFMVTAFLAGYAGITSSIRVQTANPNGGTGYELEVIAMVVIGGTLLTGGRGSVIGTIFGVLILRLMRNGIVMVGVPGLAYNIFIGAIILGMMTLHSWLERRHQAGT